MAFQTKDFVSIVASIGNVMKSTQNKVTDFNIGSVFRTLVEAPAAEMDEMYQQFVIGLIEGIQTAVYTSFSFDPIDAVAAAGLVRVTIEANEQPVLIPAGTSFSPANGRVDYTSSDDVTIPPGNTFADVLVAANSPGVIGNILAGQVFTLSPAPDGLVGATNLDDFASGTDAESEDDRKVRFNAFIQSLNRGTVAALDYGLKSTTREDAQGNLIERVVAAAVVEPYLDDPNQPIAWVQCYVHNGVGNTTSALVERAREVIYGYVDASGKKVPGWKAAGVKVDVHAAFEQVVDVAGVLTPLAGYDKPTLLTDAEQAIFGYIRSLDIGQPAILAEIIAQVMEIEGVYDFVPSEPLASVQPNKRTKLMPGAIDLT